MKRFPVIWSLIIAVVLIIGFIFGSLYQYYADVDLYTRKAFADIIKWEDSRIVKAADKAGLSELQIVHALKSAGWHDDRVIAVLRESGWSDSHIVNILSKFP